MRANVKAFLFCLTGGLALLQTTAPSVALEIELDGNVELEMRHFPNEGPMPTMEQNFVALAAEMELGLYSRDSRHAIIVKPFARYDQHDHERSHADLREAKYRYVNRSFELTIGADKEFWGVTEFLHLVDIVNQTDNVEGTDGEAKLGQVMVKASYASPYGTVTAYALPHFRIRQFADPETGRPNLGFTVDDNTVLFESGETSGRARRVDDVALRYKHSIGAFDIGLSYFDGTAREPQLLLSEPPSPSSQPVMQAFYADRRQTGLDIQATLGPWLLKFEALQSTQNRYLGALASLASPFEEVTAERATGGIEYSFYNIFNSGTDIGLVMEYMWDEREMAAPHPFGNDIGIGLRWTANDVQSTAVLIGTIIDLDSDTSLISLEAERRIGSNFKAIVEARFQNETGEDDIFAAANEDEGHIRLRLAYYF
mgnify:CR=1 FL=1